MYPLTLIQLNKRNNVYIELKDHTTLIGFMINCDVAMNIHLINVKVTLNMINNDKKLEKDIQITKQTIKIKEMYLKGQSIKLIKLHPWALSKQNLFE